MPSTRSEAVAVQAEKAVVGSHPQNAFAGFEDGANEIVGQPFGGAVGTELAVLESDEPGAVGAGPQAAVARRGEAEDAVVADGRRVIAVVDDETGAIEAHQASAGSDPQVAVRSLRECLDCVFRQAILGLPYAAGVALGQRSLSSRMQSQR